MMHQPRVALLNLAARQSRVGTVEAGPCGFWQTILISDLRLFSSLKAPPAVLRQTLGRTSYS
jgi:hypothetical protein